MKDDTISRQAAIDRIEEHLRFGDELYPLTETDKILNHAFDIAASCVYNLPSAQPEITLESAIDYLHSIGWLQEHDRILTESARSETEWNNHTVACLLAELFGDTCACNFNGIDEWLPEKCEVIDACPNPVGVACWEQFLKHRAGRRTDE